jgi:putative hydrolase of the HAD superfamily
LDDTLIDWSAQTKPYGEIMRPHTAKMHAYLTAENHDLPDADAFYERYRQTVREDWDAARGIWTGVSFYNSLRRCFAELGLNVDAIDFEAAMRAYDWQPAEQVVLYADTLIVLETLREAGYKIGLITNSMFPMWMRDVELAAYGLLDFFDARTTSGDAGYIKPHTAVFQRLLDQLETSPDQAVFVGDSPEHDIAGANAVGMISVLMSPPHLDRDLQNTEPDYTINALTELLPILDKINTNGAIHETRTQ